MVTASTGKSLSLRFGPRFGSLGFGLTDCIADPKKEIRVCLGSGQTDPTIP